MMVNVIAGENGKPNPSELLDWLSDKLQSTYSQVKQTCTGSAFCQLMDLICPGTINIDEVKFKAKDDADILNNYNLLQVAFNKAQIKKKLDLKLLVDGDVLKILDLLTWFKVFFDDGEQRQMPSCTEAKEEEHSRRLHNVVESKSSNQNIKNAKKTTDANKDLDSLFCSPAIACFIRKYCYSTSVSDGSPLTHSKVRLVLGNKYPEDITAICSQTPYCLYLFHGVDIEEEKEANVILLGFFDQASGENKIRLLDVFQQEEETADSIRTCIVEILKKFKIPLMNMALIYSNFPDPEGLLSGLRVLKPEIVSLCGLTDIAEQVCHSGVMGMEFSGQIQRLITDVYHHFPSFPPALKNLLVDTEGSDFSELLATQCSLFWRVVYKMTIAWSDLEQYFGCQDDRTDLKTTHLLLSDPKLRLNFVFLSDVLQPLSDFQESFDQGVNVTQLLQDAVQLLKFYTASFLRPGAAECFFRRGDTLLLKDTAVHLPRGEVKLGKQVASFLLQNAAELIDYLDSFHKSIISFYVTVTLVIVERLPFSDSTLRNLSLVLSPGKKLEVTGKVVQDLSTCFGICSSPEKVSLLTDEFLEYQFIDGSDTNVDDQSMEQYWKRELRIMGRTSLFGKLILSMLALPRTLKEEIIFEQVVGSQCEITDTVEDDITDSSSYKSAPSHPPTPETHDSITSDIIDLTEVEDIAPMEVEDIVSVSSESDTESKNAPKGHGAYVSVVLHDNDDGEITDDDDEITDDDDDYNNSEDNDVKWNNTANQRKRKGLSSTLNRKVKTNTPYQDGKGFLVGEMVWGQIEGFGLWPGLVQNWESEKLCDSRRKVMFFANAMTSEIPADDLLEYFSFARCFCSNSFATVTTYKDAIFHSLQVASQRSRMFFSPEVDFKDELLRVMLNWAFGGFQPSGPEGLQPQSKWNEEVFIPQPARVKGTAGISSQNNNYHSEKLFNLTICLNKLSESLDLRSGSVDLSKRGVYRKLMYPKSDAKPFQKVKTRRRKYVFRNKIQNNSQVKLRQNSHERHHMVHEVLVNGKSIKDFCLSCGSSSCEIFHPLFEGGLCFTCKDNFTETLYRYDEDGYQSYCTVCCSGMEVILCGHDSCCRSYCVDCLDILVGDGTFNKLKDVDPWICYLCAPENSYGALKPRHDWSISVQEFFANNSAMEFEPHRVYPSVPANLRRPIRVLSLFDGIATGYLVLRDLGFKVEKYVASEIDEESITVSMVNHDGKITHVDDVRKITKEHIEKWGPFDLLIGGSPCNDLSIVNPARKGLFEGTGRLFFEYYRLLNIMKPKEDDPQPFFWLFENVVFMNTRDKADICRFLECNPVLIDAVKVSPAHRARYFWGNLPGMNRPITASQNDKLSLQECLEAGRTAKFVKVRTITTRSNSLKQGNNDKHYPVTMQGKDDNIWITEMEKIFGFPKHYTDVKNMGRIQRHKVLGKSWSVPVIRHLFAPLKDYFACDEVPLK